MKFLSDILAKAGLTVDGVVTLNNTATGQTPDANDNSTKLATTAWVRTFVQPYSLPIASASVLGGIKVGSGLSINSGTGVLSVTGASAASIKSTQTFVVTEGQTVYTVTGGYTPGLIDVFLNGVYLSPNQIVATNGTTFTINDPAAAGDIVDVIVASPIFEGATTTTDQLPEGVVNLYYTNARARAAISLTTTGVSGAATYNSSTGVFNIPNYQGLVPAGGNTGDILAKTSATNYDVTWIPNYTSTVQHTVKAAVAVTKGQAVYVSSADGTNMIVSKASNASEGTSSKTLGLVAQDLAINGQGFVVTEGLLAGLNTSTATAGDPVWLGTDGNLIFGLVNKPYAPAHLVFIGVVTRVQSNNGEIFVKVQNGFELDELHDLSVKNASDGDMIKYVASTGLWTKIAATTTNITEGTNLYYTTARANSDFDTRLATKSTTNLTEGTNLYYTDTRVGTYLTANSYATQSYVSTQINNLVSGAPGLLDTLDELAAALGDDPNFATTVSTALSNRLRIDIGTQGLTSTQQGYGRTNLGLGSLAVLSSVANAQITDVAWSKVTGAPAFITGYTEVDTLASVTGRGATTSSKVFFTHHTTSDPLSAVEINGGTTHTGLYINPSDSSQAHIRFGTNGTLKWQIRAPFQDGVNTSLKIYSWVSGDDKFVFNHDGSATFNGGTVWTSTNLTNLNQLSNGPGYITSYTETDTLASVTGRGSTTSATLTSTNGLGLYVNSGAASYIGINSTSNWSYVSHLNNGTTTWDVGAFNGGQYEIRPYGGSNNRVTVQLNGQFSVNNSQNQVALFQSGNANTWVDIVSTAGTWSMGATSGNTWAIYNRSGINGTRFEVSTSAAWVNGTQVVTNSGTWGISISGNASTASQIVNNTDGAVVMESNASENNNWLWKEASKAWGLFWFNRGTQSGQTIGTYTTVGAELMFMGGNNGIAMPSGWTGYYSGSYIAAMISNYTGYIYSASTVYAATDIRSPRFYSLNSTGTMFSHGSMTDALGYNSSYGTYIGSAVGGTYYLYANGTFYDAGTIRTLIHSGNIGSQSVSYASNAGLLNALSSYVWNNSSAASTYHQGISASFVRSEVDGFLSYGSVMTVRTYSGAMGTLQLYTPYSPTYGGTRLVFRYSNYDTGTWTNWKYLLNSENDSYAYNMNQNVRTSDAVTFTNVYNYGWFRNYYNNEGFYNQANDTHFYSSSTGEWNFATSNGSWTQINLRPGGHNTTVRGAFYADSGNNVGILNNAGSWGIRLDSARHSYLYGNLTVGLTTNASSIYMSDGDEGAREIHCNSNRIGFLNQSASWGAWCDDSGNWLTGAGVYAGIFYDYDNGGYYLDPNSTSNLLHIQMPHRGNGTPNILVNNGGSENWGAIHIEGGSGNLRIGKSDAGRSWSGRVSLAMHVGASESFRVHSDGWDSLFEVWGSSGYARLKGSLEVGSDVYLGVRGTWLSSWLNQNVTTGASPSFSEVTAGYHRSYYLTGRYDVSVDHTYGIYFSSYVDYSYAIFRESGAWNHPYPDLRIAFHTGIKIGAYYGYNGTRFYNNSDMATITASVNDGDNNFRGYYDIIAYASDRRLKENIQVIDNAIDKVKQLTGMTYTWNSVGSQYGWAPSKEREAGVFAQEVQDVLPEAVKLAPFDQGHDEHGNSISKSGQNFLTVKYEKIVPLLIEAIKEQQAQIESQKSEIEELKDLVKQLINR